MQTPKPNALLLLMLQPLLLPLLILLAALLAGCATPSKPIDSEPPPRLRPPELPQSARPQPRPPTCSEGCSRGLMPLLADLQTTRETAAQTLIGSTPRPASAPGGPTR